MIIAASSTSVVLFILLITLITYRVGKQNSQVTRRLKMRKRQEEEGEDEKKKEATDSSSGDKRNDHTHADGIVDVDGDHGDEASREQGALSPDMRLGVLTAFQPSDSGNQRNL